MERHSDAVFRSNPVTDAPRICLIYASSLCLHLDYLLPRPKDSTEELQLRPPEMRENLSVDQESHSCRKMPRQRDPQPHSGAYEGQGEDVSARGRVRLRIIYTRRNG